MAKHVIAPTYEPVIHKTVSIYDLTPSLDNYNQHSQEQLDDLKASLRRFSQVDDVIVKALPLGKYTIVAHEGVTTAALQLLEAGECPHLEQWNIIVVPDSWDDLMVKGYMAASNELPRKSAPDQEILTKLLQEQLDAGYPLESMGSDDEALRQMLEELANGYLGDGEQEQEDESPEHKAGSLLALLNVTIADPTHQVHTGEVWQLGKHVLICAHVFKDWSLWTQYLTSEDCLFLPFAGPLVPLSKKADSHTLVMVQPDTYIAGHVLDRYAEIHGQHSVKMVKQFTASEEQDEEAEDESDE